MYSVLLIGLGRIGYEYDLAEEHAVFTHTRAVLRSECFELVGGVDSDGGKRSRFHVGTSVPVYHSIAEFLAMTEVNPDVCVIATNTDSHFYYWQEASKLNAKVILIEKPLFSSQSEIDEFQRHRISRTEKIMVNLIRFYQPTLNTILGEISKSKTIKVIGSVSGGMLHNGIHFLTLFERFFGPVKEYVKVISDNTTYHEFSYGCAFATLTDVMSPLENNSFFIEYDLGVFYYLDGGRKMFTISNEHGVEEFSSSEIMTYQTYVYQALEHVLSGVEDDSVELSLNAQIVLTQKSE